MSAIGQSTSLFSSPTPSVNRRAFLAGGMATGALIAGAIVIFAALAAYVAFNGNDSSGAIQANDTVVLDSPSPGAPEAAAAASPDAPAAVAAAPAAPTAVAPPPAPAPDLTTAPEAGPPIVATNLDTGLAVAIAGDGPSNRPGALGGAVAGLENTAGQLGLDVPLGDATRDVVGPLDAALSGTLNNVGSLINKPHLGDELTAGVNQLTGALLGPGGLTDRILGANR